MLLFFISGPNFGLFRDHISSALNRIVGSGFRMTAYRSFVFMNFLGLAGGIFPVITEHPFNRIFK